MRPKNLLSHLLVLLLFSACATQAPDTRGPASKTESDDPGVTFEQAEKILYHDSWSKLSQTRFEGLQRQFKRLNWTSKETLQNLEYIENINVGSKDNAQSLPHELLEELLASLRPGSDFRAFVDYTFARPDRFYSYRTVEGGRDPVGMLRYEWFRRYIESVRNSQIPIQKESLRFFRAVAKRIQFNRRSNGSKYLSLKRIDDEVKRIGLTYPDAQKMIFDLHAGLKTVLEDKKPTYEDVLEVLSEIKRDKDATKLRAAMDAARERNERFKKASKFLESFGKRRERR